MYLLPHEGEGDWECSAQAYRSYKPVVTDLSKMAEAASYGTDNLLLSYLNCWLTLKCNLR